MYSSTLSLPSALDGVGGQHHAPAALPPGKTRYPLYWRLGGPQERSGQYEKTRPYRDPIPGPSNPYRVAILTELSRPKLGSQYLQNSMFYSCEIIYIF